MPMNIAVPRNEETLESLRELSHQIIDDAIGYMRDVRDRPVWQAMP